MRTLEVRCCCDPTKVLGYLAHPKLQEVGDRLEFRFAVLAGRSLGPLGFRAGDYVQKWLELTVDQVVLDRPFAEPLIITAIKNHDYPLEDLKRIPGFVARNVADLETWSPELEDDGA